MKTNKYILFAMAGVLAASCGDIDNQIPEGNDITQEMVKKLNDEMPERAEANFAGMFSMMGMPHGTWPTGGNSSRADDISLITGFISNDLEGADMISNDNNYNWFSAACAWSTRANTYANPYIRYVNPYRQIGIANDIINTTSTESELGMNMVAQARAMRAFDYMLNAPYFQFATPEHLDKPCIPILDGKNPYSDNPRASVREVYEAVIKDLNFAVENLTENRTDKSKINKNVALGLRARANLFLGNWAEAAADAKAAAEGFTPASIDDLKAPSFYDCNDANWIWAIIITKDISLVGSYCTSPSWLSAFSGDGYAAATTNIPSINVLLYSIIPDTDVRKGWWLNEDCESPLLENQVWGDAEGQDIADLFIEDVKDPFQPYNNVKFGMKDGIGSEINSNDWPLMRVEEMILIQAEGLAKSGQKAEAEKVLTDFVKTYRNPDYVYSGVRTLEDEIWMQRRIELWGEGFATSDIKRLGKPLVRFQEDVESNYPTAFQFNVKADDGWFNLRFPDTELDNNKGVVDNTGGELPKAGQNPELRDGVTD